ncbi:hypothetical protein IscW_ISCW000388 [Ixodes scapularis]|uniref:Uncharacterized protein n=1 Tax=Ixodes scapularis TaxID=6945 RepID=B7P4Y9_IXOSC|nr:hypothetical protein IscW_ISCW000388 [Ixodes scapularis]|eukprot:XP_002406604.1 hypothetical protein IscW_ISCW000388 [Ixodes scapularis]
MNSAQRSQTKKGPPQIDRSDVLRMFRGLFAMMKLVGLLPRDLPEVIEAEVDARSIARRMRRAGVLLFIVFGYLIHFSAATVYNVTHDGGFFGFFANCGYVLRNIFAALSLVHFLVFQRVLLRIVVDGFRIFEHPPLSIERKVRRATVLAACFVVSTFVALQNTTVWVGFVDVQKYFNYYLYKGDVTQGTIPRQLGYLFSFIDATTYAIMESTLNCIITFHACVSLYLGCLCENFVRIIREVSQQTSVSGGQVKALRRLMTRLSDVMVRFDRVGSPVVFCWYANIVGSLILSTPGILLGMRRAAPSDYAYMLTDLLTMLVILVALTFALADPTSLLRSSYVHALKISTKVDIDDEEVNHSAHVLMDSIISTKVAVTGCKCFQVTRDMVLSILTMTSTYIIVVYQYIEHAM